MGLERTEIQCVRAADSFVQLFRAHLELKVGTPTCLGAKYSYR